MAGEKMRSSQAQEIGRTARGNARLETPRTCGYRTGMSSSGVIGHRLGSMFGVPSETPREMDRLLHAIDRKVTSTG